MTDEMQYLRAPDIVSLTGMSLRTVRRWSPLLTLTVGNSWAADFASDL